MLSALLSLGLALLLALAWVFARKLRILRALLRTQQRHVWETQNIFATIGAAPLPLPGGWAAGTDLLGETLRIIALQRPQRVVELGSGLSTLVLAGALRRQGSGTLVSIDADLEYLQRTQAQLRSLGLSEWVDLRHAALKSIAFEGIERPWYDPERLADLQGIDLLFIDGPPTALRRDIRYPALPFFWERLAPGATVLLDDADRRAERAIARRWQRRYVARFEHLRFEKGALRVTKPA